mmetsp:Transcript_64516/g.186960  ORF Transcript_64516/g.186960 Transcript_64516/m.186960 type:complete len:256 (-) Transcript_64516:381-1148(-)
MYKVKGDVLARLMVSPHHRLACGRPGRRPPGLQRSERGVHALDRLAPSCTQPQQHERQAGHAGARSELLRIDLLGLDAPEEALIALRPDIRPGRAIRRNGHQSGRGVIQGGRAVSAGDELLLRGQFARQQARARLQELRRSRSAAKQGEPIDERDPEPTARRMVDVTKSPSDLKCRPRRGSRAEPQAVEKCQARKLLHTTSRQTSRRSSARLESCQESVIILRHFARHARSICCCCCCRRLAPAATACGRGGGRN